MTSISPLAKTMRGCHRGLALFISVCGLAAGVSTTVANDSVSTTATPAAAEVSEAKSSIFEWQDNFVGYRFGTRYREPTNPRNITKNILQLQHSDGWKYGSNFANLDILRSTSEDPAQNGNHGATEFYFVYRGTLSLPKIVGSPLGTGGIIRDYGLTIGTDLSNKDDLFHSKVRELFVGPTVAFNVPGYLTVSLLLDKENNYNGIQKTNVHFDPTWCVSLAWGLPIGDSPFLFKGFANLIGDKGKDGFGEETRAEFLTELALMYDIFHKSESRRGTFYIGAGFQYWHNKFGNADGRDSSGGSTATVPQLLLEYHF